MVTTLSCADGNAVLSGKILEARLLVVNSSPVLGSCVLPVRQEDFIQVTPFEEFLILAPTKHYVQDHS